MRTAGGGANEGWVSHEGYAGLAPESGIGGENEKDGAQGTEGSVAGVLGEGGELSGAGCGAGLGDLGADLGADHGTGLLLLLSDRTQDLRARPIGLDARSATTAVELEELNKQEGPGQGGQRGWTPKGVQPAHRPAAGKGGGAARDGPRVLHCNLSCADAHGLDLGALPKGMALPMGMDLSGAGAQGLLLSDRRRDLRGLAGDEPRAAPPCKLSRPDAHGLDLGGAGGVDEKDGARKGSRSCS